MRGIRTTAWLMISAAVAGGTWSATSAWAAERTPAKAVAGDPYQQLPTLDFGAGEEVLAAIAKECADAKPDQYPAIEKKLISVLQAKDATLAGKQYACRMLKIVGTAQCVPAVAPLLGDEKLSHMARYALTGMKQTAVDVALNAALGSASGKVRIGIINSIGDRRNAVAVPMLAKLLTGQDDATTVAALRAIGRIGSADSAAALRQAKVADALAGEWYEARLLCGQAMLADGKLAEAKAIYGELNVSASPASVRGAALIGLVRAEGDALLPAVAEALKSNDKAVRQAASAAVIELRSPVATAAFAKALPTLPSQGKVALLHALASRGIREGLVDAVNKQVSDADLAVAAAALAALRPLGDASSVPVVAAALKNKDLAADATLTLKQLFADGVAAQLAKLAETGDAETRTAVIGLLGDRREAAALPVVLKLCGDSDRAIRMAAIKSAGALGGEKEVEPMLGLLLKSKDSGEQTALQKAVSEIALKNKDVEARPVPVINAMKSADQPTQVYLLNILASLGGKKSLETVRGSLASNVADVKRSALRALTDWTDDAPMADLQKLAKEDPDQPTRILALRGFVRMIGLPRNRRPAQAVTLYKEAMDLSTRPEEKRQVLGGLSNVKDIAALKLVQTCFTDPALKREAYSAAVKIAPTVNSKSAAEARTILQDVMTGLKDDKDAGLRNRAKEAMDKLPK